MTPSSSGESEATPVGLYFGNVPIPQDNYNKTLLRSLFPKIIVILISIFLGLISYTYLPSTAPSSIANKSLLQSAPNKELVEIDSNVFQIISLVVESVFQTDHLQEVKETTSTSSSMNMSLINSNDDDGPSCDLGHRYGATKHLDDYACPDSTSTTINSITLPWGEDVSVSVKFSEEVIEWKTPTEHIVNFISKDLKGPILSVLHTTGVCTEGNMRPEGNFYMCGPLSGIPATACGTRTCGLHSQADYSNTGWDKGHMISSREGRLFGGTGKEQQTFSMCNIWPQGKQFNEFWWKFLEFTCDGYAIDNKETLILSGPIFANGTNTCMGEFHGRSSQRTTGPTVPCDSVRPKSAPKSPIPVPSHFFKILVDLEKKIYWVFLATNDAGPIKEKQLVPSMLSTLNTVNDMTGMMAEVDLSGYKEQSNVKCFPFMGKYALSPKCNITSTLKVTHSPPPCL